MWRRAGEASPAESPLLLTCSLKSQTFPFLHPQKGSQGVGSLGHFSREDHLPMAHRGSSCLSGQCCPHCLFQHPGFCWFPPSVSWFPVTSLSLATPPPNTHTHTGMYTHTHSLTHIHILTYSHSLTHTVNLSVNSISCFLPHRLLSPSVSLLFLSLLNP